MIRIKVEVSMPDDLVDNLAPVTRSTSLGTWPDGPAAVLATAARILYDDADGALLRSAAKLGLSLDQAQDIISQARAAASSAASLTVKGV